VSTLCLVRHGQAASFQPEPAALTPLGERQAAKLAEYWLSRQTGFDEVYTGTLARQVHTEEIVAARFREAGARWPSACRDAAWNEYDAVGVLGHIVPADAGLAALAENYRAAIGGPEENRAFLRMFKPAMLRWLEDCETDGVESYHRFEERVTGAIRNLQARASARRVVVFTSGGPIGFAVRLALNAPPLSFLDVNWRVRNCSLTEFLFDEQRFSLDSFNAVPHLHEPTLLSFR
jgi:broad specificity phosphatase PhoE